MIPTRSWAIPALVVVLFCAAGAGVAAWWLEPRVASPEPEPGQLAQQIVAEVDLADVNAVNGQLAPHTAKALVMPLPTRAGERREGAVEPRPGASATPTPQASTEASTTATSSAGVTTSPSPAAAPAPSGPIVQGEVIRVEDGAALAAQLAALIESHNIGTAVRSQGDLLLVVAVPRSGGTTWHSVRIAAVTVVTGLLAALAVLLLSRRRNPSPTSDAWPPAMAHYPDHRDPYLEHRPTPDQEVLGAPVPQPARLPPTPVPRHAAMTPATDGDAPAGRVLAPSPPLSPPADPAASALLAQQRTLLAERTSLLRGLVDLLVRLPEQYAWQAAKLLAAAGAREVVPERGAAFDPAVHRVIHTAPAPDLASDDTVAQTLRAGWRDQDQVLVPAQVVVYTLDEQTDREPDDDP